MLRIFVVSLMIYGSLLAADEPNAEKLAAPVGWSGETIGLPPGFAPDMKLRGSEFIRFAPGMMKPDSESFFCYAFVFELLPEPVLTQEVVRDEFLKYYRGLCTAVLKGQLPEVDPSAFTLDLKRVQSDAHPSSGEKDSVTPARHAVASYTGTLDWVEPFATKNRQTLNLEIRTWSEADRNYIFACVSPKPRNAAIWNQLHAVRDDYWTK